MIKYKGMILDGRWEVKGTAAKDKVLLENIYNHQTMTLKYEQLRRVINGKTEISKITAYRITGKITKAQIIKMKEKISSEEGYIQNDRKSKKIL